MAIMTITINDPSLAKRSAEVAFIRNAVHIAMEVEFGRGNGNVTSGSILGQSGAGVANTSLGSWTYNSSAGGP
jgi:hypothetical protein